MAEGEWAPGTKARTVILNITTDEHERINHVGIGYDLVLPSGRVAHSSGFTWHGHVRQTERDDMLAQLQAIVDRIRADLEEHEGISP